MKMIKCKTCGREMNITEGESVVECEYCGSRQTITCQNTIEGIQEKEVQNKRTKAKKAAMIVTPIACACIAFVIILQTVIIPSHEPKQANELVASGDYTASYELPDGVNDKDSEEKPEESTPNHYEALLSKAQVGDVITFGNYEQDNITSNGNEDIEWQILDKKDGKILVISKYALDCKPYNARIEPITWEECTLREWLNSDFLNAAFTAEEQALIPTVTVSADKNPEYDTNPGNATQDQIFLLSIQEAGKYFPSDDAMSCNPTPYAIANNAYQSGSGCCWWWLRSPGSSSDYAAYVHLYGDVYTNGFYVGNDSNSVRPALWIDAVS